MAWSYSALKDAIAESGRDLLFEQANMEAPLVDMEMPSTQKKDPMKVFAFRKQPDEVFKVVAKKGGFSSTGVAADGGTRAQPSDSNISIGQAGYSILESNLFFPEGITRVARGGNGLDLYMQAVQSSGADAGSTLDRLMIDHFLGTASASALIAATSLIVNDPSGFRVNRTVDQYDSAGTTLQGTFVPSAIVFNADGTATLTIASPGLPAAVTLNSNRFYMHGSGGNVAPASRAAPINLADLSNSAIALYSGMAASDMPNGPLDSTTTSLSNTALRHLITRVKVESGEDVDRVIVNPINAERIYNNQNPQQRFAGNETLDVYGNKQMFNKAQIVEDSNCGVLDVHVLNSKERNAVMLEFWPFSPSGDGGKSSGWGREALQLSQTRLGWNLPLTAGVNFRWNKRNVAGRMSAISA